MITIKKAMYYDKIEDSKVHCYLCPHNCIIKPRNIGACRARKNLNGDLYSLNYGKVASVALDPIEKKPLYHFHPGSLILSAGTFGCNLKCSFCQNWTIAHETPDTIDAAPDTLVEKAEELILDGNMGIAYTYNEPSIWYEFVLETAKAAKEKELKNIMVTNGFISNEPLLEILPYIDAVNIDLKAFTDKFYKDICSGGLENVLNTIKTTNDYSHVEITTLLVNGYNDSNEEIRSLSKWISDINKAIPLHLSRYYPNYKFNADPTPPEKIIECREIAKEYLNFVYIGNVQGVDNNTYCPKCGEILIDRSNYKPFSQVKSNKCPKCGENINIIL
ncbi:MAG TPA: AmmeMemoRadiSam system radical SAM enzyme [Clostridia bacterium]|nr:AmmeMemoRadiSam system radical SAM enzyme [Clostridia bacterium]